MAIKHTGYEQAVALVSGHCDLERRLRDVPPSARVRGPLFRSVRNSVDAAGLTARFDELVPARKRSSFAQYPLGEYLIELAVAGALVESPAEVHQGMYEISLENSKVFAGSLMGRALLRLLAKDPVKLTEQAVAARRQMANYGEWRLEKVGSHRVDVHYTDEYTWLESAIAGAAVGSFHACDVVPKIVTTLEDAYNGVTSVTW